MKRNGTGEEGERVDAGVQVGTPSLTPTRPTRYGEGGRAVRDGVATWHG
jgi:hypothetical protein